MFLDCPSRNHSCSCSRRPIYFHCCLLSFLYPFLFVSFSRHSWKPFSHDISLRMRLWKPFIRLWYTSKGPFVCCSSSIFISRIHFSLEFILSPDSLYAPSTTLINSLVFDGLLECIKRCKGNHVRISLVHPKKREFHVVNCLKATRIYLEAFSVCDCFSLSEFFGKKMTILGWQHEPLPFARAGKYLYFSHKYSSVLEYAQNREAMAWKHFAYFESISAYFTGSGPHNTQAM